MQRKVELRTSHAFKEHTKDICIRRERTEVMPELPLVNQNEAQRRNDGPGRSSIRRGSR